MKFIYLFIYLTQGIFITKPVNFVQRFTLGSSGQTYISYKYDYKMLFSMYSTTVFQ